MKVGDECMINGVTYKFIGFGDRKQVISDNGVKIKQSFIMQKKVTGELCIYEQVIN